MDLHLIMINSPTLNLHALFAYLFSALIAPIIIFVIVHLIRFEWAMGTFVVSFLILLIVKRPETLHYYVAFVALVREIQSKRLFESGFFGLLNLELRHQSREAIVGLHNLEVAGFTEVLCKWTDMGLGIFSQEPCLALVRALHWLVLALFDMASVLLIRNDFLAFFVAAFKLNFSHKVQYVCIRCLEEWLAALVKALEQLVLHMIAVHAAEVLTATAL